MKKIIALLITALLLSALPACAQVHGVSRIHDSVKLQNTDVLKQKKIGCSICYKGDEWCAMLSQTLEGIGKYYAADIVCDDGDLNDETQTKQIENMIASNCDIIFVDPVTADGSTEALNKAVEAGIPIITFDGRWNASDGKIITNVTWNQKETGIKIGNYLVDYVKKNMDGKCRIIELGNAITPHCLERFVGLHEVIDAANLDGCDIQIITKYDFQGNRELAYNAIAATALPYDFIISDTDNGAMGAVAALKAADNTYVKVFSMGTYGAEPFGLLHENDVNFQAGLNVDAQVLAQLIFDSAIKYYKGEEIEPVVNIDLFVVDSSNVEDYWEFD